MSYESEDRYWTDYLRVALPVIGLLLMLALFWWWAQQFIGDDGDADDVAQATQTIIATAPVPTATNTVQVIVQPTESEEVTPTPEDEENGEDDGNGSGSTDEDTPDDPDQQDCEFAEGDQVVVTSDGVRIRSEPVVSEDTFIDSLNEGTTLVIIGDCYEEDEEGNQFWRVRNEETARTGYVAGEFLAPIEE